ncbi:YoaH family protein [Raoultella sp. Ech2A]|uniref:YoaH family protein n=1 Tax=Raoultella sp. Ech2A TaxID=2996539 RepID=UPI0024BF2DFE|nr:YoaH family protein [Raoultella sp. Ech2A]MDJ1656119.1 YoaH family protein [Raoultella sp. Ech2A]
MFAGLPSLSHEQQQKAVERIQELMSQGMSSGEAISLVANELRATHTGDRIVARFEDDEDDEHDEHDDE